MSKTLHKQILAVPLIVAADQVVGTLDITSCNGVSVQVNPPALAAGSIKLQRSNDNTNWEDIPSATATLAATAAKMINVADLYAGHVRIIATISAGPGEYNFFLLGKEH